MLGRDLEQYAGQFSEYTELRAQENRSVGITMVDGTIMANNQSSSSGISARVFRRGSWGFASNPDFTPQSVSAVIASATENARFMDSRLDKGSPPLPSRPGRSESDYGTRKPRATQRQMIDFMKELDAHIQSSSKGISSRTISLSCLDMEKALVSSDGASAYALVPRSLCYVLLATQRDGTPYELFDVFGGRGQYEDVFERPDELYPKIDALAEDLARKADGIHAEAGVKDCVLHSHLAGVLAHEAIGHTTEADMVMGGSVAAEFVGKEVASPLVGMVDFAHTAFGTTCPVPVHVDDEGVQARDAVLIERGVLKGFMHNKESAAHFGVEPTGNAKAFRFSDEPIIRMRNTIILPGSSSLEEMIGSVDDGYYLMRFSNGQADSTSEFMFGITLGYEIKGGKLGRGIRDTTISGVAFDMLKTVTMISRDMSWSCSGMCGKKQPIPVGMGGPALRCRVSIGGR